MIRRCLITLACVAAALVAMPASALYVNPQGTGSVLLFPYYSVNAGQQTVLSIVNTTARAKIFKAQFREGYNSREVLNFNVVLAPHDTWTATIFAQDDSDARLVTRDASCTHPEKYEWTGPFPGGGYQQTFYDVAYTAHHADTGPTSPARRREGHFEFVELAELTGALAAAVTGQHPPNCLPFRQISPYSADLHAPAGGVYGDFAIVDVAEGTLFGGRATAIDDYSQQPLITDTAALLHYIAMGNSRSNEVDAVLPAGAGGTTLTYALVASPGQPYGGGLSATNAVLMSDSVFGAMSREAGVGSHTEWVLTMPTKYLHTDNETLGLPLGDEGAIPPFDSMFGASHPGASCSRYTATAHDREGRPVQFLTDPEFPTPPPGQRPQHALCYAANVVHFSDLDAGGTTPLLGSKLGSKLWNPSPATTETANVRIDLGPVATTGSVRVLPPGLRGPALRGLPLIGFEAVRYINGSVSPGALANYTLATPLRATVACAQASGEPTACP